MVLVRRATRIATAAVAITFMSIAGWTPSFGATGDLDDVVTITIKDLRGSYFNCSVEISARNLDPNTTYKMRHTNSDIPYFDTNARGSGSASSFGNDSYWVYVKMASDVIFTKSSSGLGEPTEPWSPGKVTIRNACKL